MSTNEHRDSKSFINIFKYISIMAVIITAISISCFVAYLEYINFSKRADKLESEYVASQKLLIKQEVLKVTDYIAYSRRQTQHKVEQRVKERTYDGYATALNIFNKFSGELPDKKIKELIIAALRPVRFFNAESYYFINTMDGVTKLHALRPDLEENNNLDFQSSNGRYVVKELRELVKNSGEGFLTYGHPSFGEKDKDKPKITYVKYFEPYDWYIGTGDYLDNIDRDIQRDMLEYIKNIKFGLNSYIFVVNYDGVVMMNVSQPHLIGKNIWDIEDPNGVKVIQEERKAVENPEGGYIHYVWNKPSTSIPSPKTSFMKGVKDWQWMVGAGIYLDDVQMAIQDEQDVLKNGLIKQAVLVLFTSVLVSLLIILLADKITKRFSREIMLFSNFFKNVSIKNEKIDYDLLQYSELRSLAVSANKMLDEKIAIEIERNKAEKSLRMSETRLKEAEMITHYGSWELNLISNELVWSDEVYRIFEIDSEDVNPSYELFLDCVHPDDRKLVEDTYNNALKNSKSYEIEHLIKTKNGEIKRVREHAEIFRDKDDKPIRVMGSVQDVTELRLKEEQLKRSQKMDALGKLTGGIAHDYNNMLGIIIGYSELLHNHTEEGSANAKYVKAIQLAGERGKTLTDKLMTFSRYKQSETQVIDINHELDTYREMLEKTLTARIKLTMNLDKAIWPIKLDSGDLSDSVVNMAINASHAIKSNGQLIITTCNKHLNDIEANTIGISSGDYVMLSIKDTGAGMDSEVQSRVFDPFYSTKGAEGTGLGLSQVYGFALRSGGTISLSSEINIGSEFTLYFPRVHIETPPLVKEESNCDSRITGSETILVVDDEPLLGDIAGEILRYSGYSVLIATSAEQALNILKSENVDLILSDVIMPNMNGYQLKQEVASKYPNIMVQLTSGYNDIKGMTAEDDISKHNILQKPFASKDLLKRVREMLDRRR